MTLTTRGMSELFLNDAPYTHLFFNDGQLRHNLLHAAVSGSRVFAKGWIVKVDLLQCQNVLSALLTDLIVGAQTTVSGSIELLTNRAKKAHLKDTAKGTAAQMVQNRITIDHSQRRSVLVHRLYAFSENSQFLLLQKR